jgi:hypothetical protein
VAVGFLAFVVVELEYCELVLIAVCLLPLIPSVKSVLPGSCLTIDLALYNGAESNVVQEVGKTSVV